MTLGTILILLASVSISSMGHLCLKLGADKRDFSLGLWNGLSAWIVLGIGLHGSALLLWTLALRKTELSSAFPFLALSYVMISILSFVVLNEQFGVMKLAGTCLVVVGVFLIVSAGK